MTVLRQTIKGQKVGSGPIPGKSSHFRPLSHCDMQTKNGGDYKHPKGLPVRMHVS